MRFAFISDTHIGCTTYGKFDPSTGLSSRTVEFLNVLNWCLRTAKQLGSELIVLGGDIFDNRTPNIDTIKAVRNLLDSKFPHIVLGGNHDCPGISSRTSPLDLIVSKETRLFREVGAFCYRDLHAVCLPYPIVDQYISPLERQSYDQKSLEKEVVRRALERVKESLRPNSIVLSHIAIEGAIVSSDSRGVTQEFEFPVKELDELDVPVIAGHVHYYQQIARKVYYAGSPVVTGFGESYIPGFLMVDWDDKSLDVRFIPVDILVFDYPRTVYLEGSLDRVVENLSGELHEGGIVRFIITCNSEEKQKIEDAVKLLKNNTRFCTFVWKLNERKESISRKVENLSQSTLVENYIDEKAHPSHKDRLGHLAKNIMKE